MAGFAKNTSKVFYDVKKKKSVLKRRSMIKITEYATVKEFFSLTLFPPRYFGPNSHQKGGERGG